MAGAMVVGCAAVLGAAGGLVAWACAARLVSADLPRTSRLVAAVACALACAGIAFRFGPTPESVELCALSGVLVCVSLTDLAELRIPNVCLACAVVVRLAYLAFAAHAGGPSFGSALLVSLRDALVTGTPLAALVLVMDAVLGSASMGGGDLKLFCLGGFFFGWRAALVLVFVSCVLGLAFALVRAACARKENAPNGGHAFPFGPAIACASWLVALCSDGVNGMVSSLLF